MGDLQTDQGESLELQLRAGVASSSGCSTRRRRAAARAAAFAALARINTLYMIAGAWSGHIGTSFSSLEIMSWLFLNELRDLDKGHDACDIFFSSKGHDAPALYAVLIGLGLLPAETAPPAPPPARAAGPSRTSRRRTSRPTPARSAWASRRPRAWRSPTVSPARPRRIFVLTGDGELQEGQFWESLGVGRQRAARRDRRHHRPQQDSVRHLGRTTSAPRRSRGEVPRVRLARQRAATATTSRRSSATFRALDAVHGSAQGDHRRHRQGERRVASWKGPPR